MSNETPLTAECDEVCTVSCHASDCEHHGHLAARQPTVDVEALAKVLDAADALADAQERHGAAHGSPSHSSLNARARRYRKARAALAESQP